MAAPMTATPRDEPEGPYVHPDVRRMLDAADPDAKDFWEMTPDEARAASDLMVDGMLAPPPVAAVTDLQVPTTNGHTAARLYRLDPTAAAPLLVLFHGGGWEVGSLDVADESVRRLVLDTGVTVLSVEYRLAPEHPFPAGLDDCYDATVWAYDHQAELGSDGSFFGVGGDSSGGNLAAAVAQRARDEAGPPIDHQLLVYPVVSRDFETDSYLRFGTGYFLTRASMQAFWRLYAGPSAAPPYADLYAAGSLRGLPPATVLTCGLDPLQDEGNGYAERLAEAGVEVTRIHAYGLIHGIWYMDAAGDRAYQFGLDVAGALTRAIARTADAPTG